MIELELIPDLSPLDAIEAALEPIRVPVAMRQTSEFAAGEFGRNFLGSHTPTGQAWPPLKRPRPLGHNPGTRPLIDTGMLMHSVISDGPGHVNVIADDLMTIGTTNFKAVFHQFGTKHKSGTEHIPARPFIGANDRIADQAAEYVLEELAFASQFAHRSPVTPSPQVNSSQTVAA